LPLSHVGDTNASGWKFCTAISEQQLLALLSGLVSSALSEYERITVIVCDKELGLLASNLNVSNCTVKFVSHFRHWYSEAAQVVGVFGPAFGLDVEKDQVQAVAKFHGLNGVITSVDTLVAKLQENKLLLKSLEPQYAKTEKEFDRDIEEAKEQKGRFSYLFFIFAIFLQPLPSLWFSFFHRWKPRYAIDKEKGKAIEIQIGGLSLSLFCSF
jgi:hypothetical protein